MKYLYTLLIFMLSFSSALADDKYTNNIYTSYTLLYWCTYKEVPTSKDDIAKVTNVDYPDEDITIDLDDWLKSLSYEINGDVMTIIKESTVLTDRNYQTTLTSTSSSNCNSIEVINNQPE